MRKQPAAALLFFALFVSGCGGNGDSSQTASFLASSVSAGDFHACALLSDGTANCWGLNSTGALGNGSFIGFTPPGPTAPVTTTINPVQAAGITSATDIGAGFSFSCSMLSDSTVRCWGDNSLGQLGSGTGISVMTPVEVTK